MPIIGAPTIPMTPKILHTRALLSGVCSVIEGFVIDRSVLLTRNLDAEGTTTTSKKQRFLQAAGIECSQIRGRQAQPGAVLSHLPLFVRAYFQIAQRLRSTKQHESRLFVLGEV